MCQLLESFPNTKLTRDADSVYSSSLHDPKKRCDIKISTAQYFRITVSIGQFIRLYNLVVIMLFRCLSSIYKNTRSRMQMNREICPVPSKFGYDCVEVYVVVVAVTNHFNFPRLPEVSPPFLSSRFQFCFRIELFVIRK